MPLPTCVHTIGKLIVLSLCSKYVGFGNTAFSINTSQVQAQLQYVWFSSATVVALFIAVHTKDCTPILWLCQGMLVGKVLTKADVEHCRIVLPRMAMEANFPEVVEANELHVVSTLFTSACKHVGVCIAVDDKADCLCIGVSH